MDTGRRLGEQLLELGPALLERPRAPVLAVKLQQVEGIKKHLIVTGARLCSFSNTATPASSQQTASPSIAADVVRNPRHRPADERMAVGPIVAAARERPHPAVPLARDKAITVVLNFLNPLRPNRRLQRPGRDARLDSAKALRTRQHA
jgi:hypothetical protein